jgi:hypothetical protein
MLAKGFGSRSKRRDQRWLRRLLRTERVSSNPGALATEAVCLSRNAVANAFSGRSERRNSNVYAGFFDPVQNEVCSALGSSQDGSIERMIAGSDVCDQLSMRRSKHRKSRQKRDALGTKVLRAAAETYNTSSDVGGGF